ncbi:MAG: hypothetical protein ACXACY_29550, partial [Candidatus Hodarchaeales archaeon]
PRKVVQKEPTWNMEKQHFQYTDLDDPERNIYSFARHIVTNSFTLEYADMPEINIKELEIGDE